VKVPVASPAEYLNSLRFRLYDRVRRGVPCRANGSDANGELCRGRTCRATDAFADQVALPPTKPTD
jgi:hypothetical protein